ncbi:MAG: hypothetical protein JSU66_16075 [Deltaproteobacteria bacterium]|nr:MAG: hypothetical protein JSU66_16075 [Deltaproteobacteria bacterium]
MPVEVDRLFDALRAAGMTGVPVRFSVVPSHQVIPRETLDGIDAFIRLFDRVTTRRQWCEAATGSAPEVALRPRREVCFFSAWDFHISPEHPGSWQLIECNDNGSGFLFAARINRIFYELSSPAVRAAVEPPPALAAFDAHLAGLVEREAVAFFGEVPRGTFLILDDADSLARGRFRDELSMLRDRFRSQGWEADVAAPDVLRWHGGRLVAGGREVRFVVNRSTDFFLRDAGLAPLREAYLAGRVYIAPNPFTYATRSDKRLLEWLSLPERDAELGIRPEERAVLRDHVPESRVLRAENLDALALRKDAFVFKPCHGFAGRGLLPSAQVGQTRLRRLLRRGEPYLAQRRVPKHRVTAEPGGTAGLWADLRVWAYRGERFLVSGRASRRPDRIDLAPPGGWIPTFPAGQPS